jgi:hypothetical protein
MNTYNNIKANKTQSCLHKDEIIIHINTHTLIYSTTKQRKICAIMTKGYKP